MPFTTSNKDNKLSQTSRLPTTDPIAISKIYPTPPSVETTDKRYDEVEMEESHPVDIWDGEVRDGDHRTSSLFTLPLSPSNPLLSTLWKTR